MTDEQIKMLRCLIQAEIERAKIDDFEHGAWGWAESQLNESWGEFQQSFADLDPDIKTFNSIEELFEDLHADERAWLRQRLAEEEI